MTQGSRTAAVKANLEKMGKRVLLVEGIDDWHAFGHMIQTATGALPVYDLGYCGNDDGVLDVLHGATLASRPSQTILGAVLDADRGEVADSSATGVQARIRSLQSRLCDCYAIPSEFPADG
jgi:hypothetical protein